MSSSGMADVGACHTVDTWRHARGFTMFAVNVDAHNTVDAQRYVGVPYRMGVNDAHNTVGENVGAYNTVWVTVVPGRLQSTVSASVQGTVSSVVV